MQNTAKRQSHEFAGIVDAIADERVRYFYLMLGDALGHATGPQAGLVNTGPAHIAGIATRLNSR